MTYIRNGNRYTGDNSSMSSWGSNYSPSISNSDDFSYNFDKEVQIDKSKRFIIKDMEKFILNKINKEKTRDTMCAICINDYKEGDEIISLSPYQRNLIFFFKLFPSIFSKKEAKFESSK